MARYPGAEREQRIEAGKLLRQVTAIFAACGMSDDDAALLAPRSVHLRSACVNTNVAR